MFFIRKAAQELDEGNPPLRIEGRGDEQQAEYRRQPLQGDFVRRYLFIGQKRKLEKVMDARAEGEENRQVPVQPWRRGKYGGRYQRARKVEDVSQDRECQQQVAVASRVAAERGTGEQLQNGQERTKNEEIADHVRAIVGFACRVNRKNPRFASYGNP